MSTLKKFVTAFLLILLTAPAFAQNDAHALVEQGIKLFDQGKYTNAIEKYQAALKIDSTDLQADYELGYTLYVSGKPNDAIPYLERILKSNASKYEAYEVLGSIYDDNNQPEKAIECYKAGLKEKPDFERLYYNLGLTYLRQKQYAQSLSCAINALKLKPDHASAHWLFAMAADAQGKRGAALLAYSNFLLLEPQTKRSAQVIPYVINILNYGITSKDSKNISISTHAGNPSELAMQLAVVAATTSKTGLSATDSLQLQLKSVYSIAHIIADDKAEPFIGTYYADYFEKLAKSDNMPAFTRYIMLSSAKKDEYIQWFKDHDKELKDLGAWVDNNPRKF